MKQTIKNILEKAIGEDIKPVIETDTIKATRREFTDPYWCSIRNQAKAEMRAKIDDIAEEIIQSVVVENMPEFNSFQLELIIDGLKDLDLSKYDKGYQEVHKHLLARLTK
jgi:hypothetical protein